MYKIVYMNSDVEPVAGFRTDNKENALKLVDAWNENFTSQVVIAEV